MGRPRKPADRITGHRTAAELEGRSTSVVLPDAPVVEWLDSWRETTGGRTVEVVGVDGETLVAPAPPSRLLKVTRQRWAAFWSTAEASMVRPHHLPALERLARLWDQEERIFRRLRDKRVVSQSVPLGMDGEATDGELVVGYEERGVELPGHLGVGSTGQITVSADMKALLKIQSEIRQLEDRFAASPAAEFRVGWQHAEMLNARARVQEAAALSEAAAELQRAHEQHARG